MEFKIETYVAELVKEPTLDKINKLKKEELFVLVEHYGLEARKSMKKVEIKRVLVEHLVEEGILPEGILEDLHGKEAEVRQEKLMTQQIRLKELELKEKEMHMQMQKEEIEARLKEKQMEFEKEVRLKELEVKQSESFPSSSDSDFKGFDVSKQVRLVPRFQESEVDKYFMHFEKVATTLGWPKGFWTLMLQSTLVGKAEKAYAALSIEQSSDYGIVKQAILAAYELVPEAYRQKFRNSRKQEAETFLEFASNKEHLFDRWCESVEIGQDFRKMRELMLVEEFKRCIPKEIKTHLDEQRILTLHDAAISADNYFLTHKSLVLKVKTVTEIGGNQGNFRPKGRLDRRIFSGSQSSYTDVQEKSSPSKSGPGVVQPSEKSGPTCYYCKKKGHIKSECWTLAKKNSTRISNALATIKSPSKVYPVSGSPKAEDGKVVPLSIDEGYKPFVTEGFVSLCDDDAHRRPVTILRDTGASQSLLVEDVLTLSENSSVGASVLMCGVECGSIEVPLHKVFLCSDLVNGPVVVGVRPSLPMEGITFLLGNDLAGGRVVPNPQVVPQPMVQERAGLLEEVPDIFPACAVTRAMSHRGIGESKDQDSPNLRETFIAHLGTGQDPGGSDVSLSSCDHNDRGEEFEELPISRQILIAEQARDPELISLNEDALKEDEAEDSAVCYYKRQGVLMRKWRPPDALVEDEWRVYHQIVVPQKYRQSVLSLAHDAPLAGHLGVNKTYEKLRQHFYWLKMKQDVVQYCRTCTVCQRVGKPNQTIPKAPLQPVPAFQEPFNKVIVDCVGPLPKTRSGNQYLLTIMCAATRYPEAIPLRNITSTAVIKSLIKFFTIFGLPFSVQTDQGSNFMSHIFKQVMAQLGIHHYTSSAYHPQSQGALERFHQTLKTMLRAYCLEYERDWDEGIPLLLFAVRESVQESIGFSPNELVFGHTVRGPLKLLKERWLAEDTEAEESLLKYVSVFRERLTRAGELAKQNLGDAQEEMKAWYDKKARQRHFKPGDKVLVLLPVAGHPLQAKYHGPCVVSQKIGELNYVVETPDRKKKKQLCHVNMLKPYYERESKETEIVLAVIPDRAAAGSHPQKDSVEEKEFEVGFEEFQCKLQNSQVLANLEEKLCHLSGVEKKEMMEVIQKYKHIFSDVPGRTSLISHDVEVEGSVPIKQHPYRVNPRKLDIMHAEIQYMLDNDLIEKSSSSWSSPCILVPKADNSYRFVTDFRKVNLVTKTDSFPIPRIEDCIDQIGNAQYVSKVDLLKGYWQVPLTERAKEVSAFVIPDNLYQYKVMPFGMKNSAATFQRLVNIVIAGLKGCRAYIDDIVIYTDNWKEHVQRLCALFDRLAEANLTVNLVKSEFGKAQVIFLGFIVGQGLVKPVQAKIEAIVKFPVPRNRRELKRFLGMVGYYRKFCRNFSEVVVPLTNLLTKGNKFIWSQECSSAFSNVKAILMSEPVLVAPDFKKPFKLAVDASDVGCGAVLLQEDSAGVEHPVCYFSKKFDKHQKNYSTIEKEALSILLALQHFDVYLSQTMVPIHVYTDHNPLTFVHKMKGKNQRLMRWSLALQQYNIDIEHIKGSDNVIADALSRAPV